jgi:S-adenosylmethionine:tRNA ribosyltransferase-isomerase
MAVNATHPDHDASAPAWARARSAAMPLNPPATNTVAAVLTNFIPVFYTNLVQVPVTNLVARPEAPAVIGASDVLRDTRHTVSLRTAPNRSPYTLQPQTGISRLPCPPGCHDALGSMRTADFDYDLPPELIAQAPAPQRDESRLLVLHRGLRQIEHREFRDLLEYLRPGDVLVLNNSRVIPARLRGTNAQTGGQFELLLLEENATNDWWLMLRPGKRARAGTQIVLRDTQGRPTQIQATVLEKNDEGHRRLRFTGAENISDLLDTIGEVPLPPYIVRTDASHNEEDRQRYQTVFAQPAGSVAAPTAGLHFTEALLETIRARGVEVCFLTLHVGAGTFAPVKTESIAAHVMHEERYEVADETARVINAAKKAGRRVIAVGTTTVRVLESLARTAAVLGIAAGSGQTQIFIHPPYDFKIVDALLTNFHLPRSTLLMLTSAFAAPNATGGRELALRAYVEAVRERYRFFSYGDAMLIL